MAEDNTAVRDNPDESRYEILLGDTLAGFTEYALHGSRADFVHTEVRDEFEGQGLASRLIAGALDDARSRAWEVVPYCPFVRKFIAKHAEYADLVPDEFSELTRS